MLGSRNTEDSGAPAGSFALGEYMLLCSVDVSFGPSAGSIAGQRSAEDATLSALARALHVSRQQVFIEAVDPSEVGTDADVSGDFTLDFRVLAEGPVRYRVVMARLRLPDPAELRLFLADERAMMGLEAANVTVSSFGEVFCPCPSNAGRGSVCSVELCTGCLEGEVGGASGVCSPCDGGFEPSADRCVQCPMDSAGTRGRCSRCVTGTEPNSGQTFCVALGPGLTEVVVITTGSVVAALLMLILCFAGLFWRPRSSKARSHTHQDVADMISDAVARHTPPSSVNRQDIVAIEDFTLAIDEREICEDCLGTPGAQKQLRDAECSPIVSPKPSAHCVMPSELQWLDVQDLVLPVLVADGPAAVLNGCHGGVDRSGAIARQTSSLPYAGVIAPPGMQSQESSGIRLAGAIHSAGGLLPPLNFDGILEGAPEHRGILTRDRAFTFDQIPNRSHDDRRADLVPFATALALRPQQTFGEAPKVVHSAAPGIRNLSLPVRSADEEVDNTPRFGLSQKQPPSFLTAPNGLTAAAMVPQALGKPMLEGDELSDYNSVDVGPTPVEHHIL